MSSARASNRQARLSWEGTGPDSSTFRAQLPRTASDIQGNQPTHPSRTNNTAGPYIAHLESQYSWAQIRLAANTVILGCYITAPNVTNFMRSSRVQWQLYLLGAIFKVAVKR